MEQIPAEMYPEVNVKLEQNSAAVATAGGAANNATSVVAGTDLTTLLESSDIKDMDADKKPKGNIKKLLTNEEKPWYDDEAIYVSGE